ncbi:MAG: ChaN family lipoprotein, partial [Thermodesulfovibrionales bacterium]|nr:ChaN family lipoprotein [Thermodesulfovibrionales bacterium]
NYVMAGKDFPLKEFMHDNDAVSRTIGIGKGTMLFHMLRGATGDEVFFNALRRLIRENKCQQTSWTDIRTAFEKASGENLEWFFSQWLERKGVPEIGIKDQRVTVVHGVQTISFEIIQKGEPYRFALPLTIRTDKGEVMQTLDIGKEKEIFELPVEGTPLGIVFDRDYDVMRKLVHEESPLLISGLLGDDKKLLLIPDEEREKYSDFIDALKKAGFPAQEESEINDEDIKSHSLLIFGNENRVVKRLFGHIEVPATGFSLSLRKNPLNQSKVIAIAYADTKEDIPSQETISHMDRYSSVRFRNGKNVEKTAGEAARGIVFNLHKPLLTIQPGKLTKLEDDFDNILNKTVIYAGERHMNYEDHQTQLKIIMNLHERGHKFAIGMEMFQRPFQKDINDYLSGALSEKEFLKRTQYFKRWQFDYNLYQEIIEYAKAKRIPIIALNLWTEIVKKVSTDGLDSLTDIERAELPDSMDMSDEEYRNRLDEVFRQHKSRENKTFENFYQAQILWDETMARSIDEFLRKNPGYQMIVLAGAGHIMYGSGIPKRAYRLNKKDYVIVLPGGEFIDTDIGDYLVTAEPVAPPTTLKLGVVLKEHDGHVEIGKVVPGSIAKSAGLEKGDILLSLNDWKIEDIDDVNIFMFDKKRGEKITIKVLRKKFLVGYKEVVLNGTI